MAEEQDMTRESNQSTTPLLCSAGCGFYGHPRNDGMCSVCYRNVVQRQNGGGGGRAANPPAAAAASQSAAAAAAVAASPAPVSPAHIDYGQDSEPSTSAAASAQASASVTADGDPPRTPASGGSMEEAAAAGAAAGTPKPKAEKNRCFTCRKKVGLAGFDCRCGNHFCSLHRYSDTHNCTFDYRAEGAERLRRENPKVAGEKIQKL